MIQTYRDDTNVLEWYKCIRDDASDKAIGIETKVEVDVGVWDIQRPEGLLHPIRKLEIDK